MATRKKLSNRRKKQISRDCWDLDYAFYKWLLEHLQVYLKDATGIIDLEYHKAEYNGKEYTQREAIERMIETCKWLTRNDFDYIWDRESDGKVNELLDLWKIWHTAMWW